MLTRPYVGPHYANQELDNATSVDAITTTLSPQFGLCVRDRAWLGLGKACPFPPNCSHKWDSRFFC
jgi:hypothetical protein